MSGHTVVAEIVLPAGTMFVTAGEIPQLIAGAIYPSDEEVAPPSFSHWEKRVILPSGWCAKTTEPLTEEDVAFLNQTWAGLPDYAGASELAVR